LPAAPPWSRARRSTTSYDKDMMVSYTAAEMARIIEDMISQLDPSGTQDFDVVLRDVSDGMISITLTGMAQDDEIPTIVPALLKEYGALHATLH
jgi:hypothetical protein